MNSSFSATVSPSGTGSLRLRLLTAMVGLPIVLGIVWWGGSLFTITVAAVAVGGLWELYTMGQRAGLRPERVLGVGLGLALVSASSVEAGYVWPVLAIAALVVFLWMLRRERGTERVRDWAFSVGGLLYVPLLLVHILVLRNIEDGRDWVLLLFAATFSTDTLAYAVGSLVGRHRMAPNISPGKTWEGAAGGMVGAVAAVIVVNSAFDLGLSQGWAVFLGLLVGLAAQLGDLFESFVKRRCGVKDSGRLVAGHGGLLDRLDSLLPVGAVLYWSLRWLPR